MKHRLLSLIGGLRRTALLAFAGIAMQATQVFAVDLSGNVQTPDGEAVCALALASGRTQFTCGTPLGAFSFTGLPTEPDGSVKLQVYADGFFPNIMTLREFSPQTVVLERALECGGEQTDREKTESLRGVWQFLFSVGGTSFNPVYSLTGPLEQTQDGMWLLLGFDDVGNPDVGVSYTPQLDAFVMVDIGNSDPNSALSYVFSYTSSNTVSGEVYIVEGGGTPEFVTLFNGTRTGASEAAVEGKRQAGEQVDLAAQLLSEVAAIREARKVLDLVESDEVSARRVMVQQVLEQVLDSVQAQ